MKITWKEIIKKSLAIFTVLQMFVSLMVPALTFAGAPSLAPGSTVLVGWTFPSGSNNENVDVYSTLNSAKQFDASYVDNLNYNYNGYDSGSDKAATAKNWDENNYWKISLNSTGYTGLKLYSKQRSDSKGPKDFEVEYRISSGAWTGFTGNAYSITNASWHNDGNNVWTLPSALNNKTSIDIRFRVDSNSAATGNGNIEEDDYSSIDDVFVVATGVVVVDTDNDGVPDIADNCPTSANATQSDNDIDGFGDACDSDDDNDTVLDISDNCPLVANSDQANSDGDLIGNVCDSDDDNDTIIDTMDNCPLVSNMNQSNNDNDSMGDVCDSDDDNDGYIDTADNCPLTANSSQADTDGDNIGDACDAPDVEDYPTKPSIVSPIYGQYLTTTPILNDWTAAEDEDGICEYQIEYIYDDGHTFVGAPYRYTDGGTTLRYHQPSLAEQGGVTIRVRAIDCEDNLGDWSEPVHYYYDATRPTTPTITGFENPNLDCGSITNQKSTTVQWTDSADNLGLAGYQYEVAYPLPGGGQGLWSPFLATPPYISQYAGTLNEGVHSIRVRARDMAGQYSDWSNTCTITADWTAPDVLIDNPAGGSMLRGSVDIRGSVIDDNPHHYWFVVSGPNGVISLAPSQTGTINESESFSNRLLATWDTTDFPDGQYVIKLEARDAAGNKDGGSVDWHYVIVDNTSPTVDIVFNLGTGSTATGFQVVFSEDVKKSEAENPANYFLTNWPGAGGSGDLIGDATVSYNSQTRTATVTFLNSGWYVSPEQLWGLQNIHDLSGNLIQISPYSEYSTPMINPSTTPDFEGLLGLDGSYRSGVTVNLVAADSQPGSGIKQTYYSLDGLIFYSGSSFFLNSEGENHFWYYSVDNAGNEENVHYGSLVIDRVGPSVAYINPTPVENSVLDDDNFEVRADSEDSLRCELYLNGALVGSMDRNESGEFALLLSGLEDGDYEFYVICYDAAGNETRADLRSLSVDQTPPTLSLIGSSTVSLLIGAVFTDPGATAFDAEDGDITSKIQKSGDSVNTSVAGTYTIRYNVSDSADNSATEVTRVVTVIVPPVVTTGTTGGILTPASSAAPLIEEDQAVAGAETARILEAEDLSTTGEDAAVKGSTDVACPWWWIILLVSLVVLAFVGGIARGADEERVIRKYYYVWPMLTGAVAWFAHSLLHNDYAATWFCNNYLLVALALVAVSEVVYYYMIGRKSNR